VRVPATPRAKLVRLPDWTIGQHYWARMPYGQTILTTYRGDLPSERMLPYDGSVRLGDMRMVQGTPWVFTIARGALSPDWIDP
jgi:hypothetical protein